MPRHHLQPAFSGGVISPKLYARVDLAKYQTALREAKNAIVHAYGGLSNRPGTEFIAEVKDSAHPARLIPFQFSTEQAYALEFGNSTMRVIMDGGMVLEATQAIAGATAANPVVITCIAHGYSNGDVVYIAGAGGMTEINGRFFTVAGATANTFQLQGINGSGYTAYTSGGTVARVFSVASPFPSSDLFTVKYTQSADVMSLAHPSYAPRELTRTGHAAWTFSTISFAPSIAAPTGLDGTPSTAGAIAYQYKVTAVAEETFEESLPTAALVVNSVDLSSGTHWIDLSWTNVAGVAKWNVYKLDNGIFGYIGSTESNAFQDDNIDPDVTDTPPAARNPFSGTNLYPGCVAYHDQRRMFGGSNDNPQTIWGTQTGNYYNMNVSSPAKDDDAVTYTIGARQVNRIRHFVSLGDLLVMTSGGEWKMSPGSNGDAISPSSVRMRPQSYWGCSDVPPIVIGNTALFIQERGSKIREVGYSFESDSYTGNDLTVLAEHLFEEQTIVDWAYAQNPDSILWCVRSDGKLLSLTYMREQQVWAWTWHETDGWFESICSIPEGSEDAVYFVVRRMINGMTKRTIERLHTRYFLDSEDCFFVDSGVTVNNWNLNGASTVTATGGTDWTTDETLTMTENAVSSPFTASDVGRTLVLRTINADGTEGDRCHFTVTAYNSATSVDVTPDTVVPVSLRAVAVSGWGWAFTHVPNLEHLEGKTVSILGDGAVLTPQTVSGGAITLGQAVVKAQIGLPYEFVGETLDVELGDGGSQSRKKHIPAVTALLHKSRGGWYGPEEGHMRELKQEYDGDNRPVLISRKEKILIPGQWNRNGRVRFRQSDPLPMTLLGIIPEVEIAR